MSVEIEQVADQPVKKEPEKGGEEENVEKKKRGTNRMPPTSTNPNTLFKKGRISREEWIKLTRQKKKERAAKWREENGIPEPERKFNLNNEKIWFRNTYRQTKVHLVNNFVNKLKKYRYSREKLTTEVDMASLSEQKKKNIQKKLLRCKNAEESLLKEMYLIKSWKANDVFEMLLKNEPVPFADACQIAHDTGNLDLRARERIRQYKLVLPVWEKLNKELKLFDSSRSLEGASKAAALAKTVLEESEKQTSKEKVSSEVSKASIKKESSENPDSQPSSKKQIQRKIEPESDNDTDGSEVDEDDMPEEISNADAARFDFNKLGKLVQKADATTKDEEEKEEEEDEEEEDDFKEYSSDEESEKSEEEEEEHVKEALKEDEPFEIEFALPKSFQNKTTDAKAEVKPEIDVKTDDFDADSESSDDERAESDDENESSDDEGDEEKETSPTNGFFMTADHKPVKVAKTSKKEVKRFAKDNRDGQRERKRHAKAVYGQNLIEMEKQAQQKQKLAAKKERKAEKRKLKEEKKNQPAELHGSWAASKRAKEQTVIQKFEGKKITFDDSD